MKRIKGKIGIMASAFLMLSTLVPNSVLAGIAEDFPEVSLQTIQMITTMPSLAGIVFALLVGRVTPYIYKKYLIITGACLYLAGGIFPYFFHGNIGCMLLGAGVLGIGMGIMITCIPALICECYGEKESGILMGLQAAFISGGGMVFIWLGGQLGKDNWENAYLAYLLAVVIIVIDIFCLPKGKLEQKEEKGEGRGRVPGSVWFVAILGFLVYAFINIYNSNVSMLVEIRSLGGPVEASYASMCNTFAGMIAGCLTGIVIPKVKRHIFTIATLLALAGMAVTFFFGELWGLCLGGMLCGASFATYTPAGSFYAAQDAGEDNRSLCIAIVSSVSNLGQAISPILIAILMGPFSIEQRFLGGAIAFGAITVFTIIGVRKFTPVRATHNPQNAVQQ